MTRPGRDPPGHPLGPRLPDFLKSPLLGGWGFFLSCLRELGKKAQLPRLLHQRAISALAQCRAGRRIPIASSRCRQRQRRSEVRSVSEALILGGLERALNFDARCAKRHIHGCVQLIAAQVAGLACRADPLELKAGKRGRSRQVFDSILEGARNGSDDRLLIGGIQWSRCWRTASSCRGPQGCHARKCMRCPSLQVGLCPSLPASFNSPDSHDCKTGKAGFHFGADPVQWRACPSLMARARLLRVLPSDTGTQTRIRSFCGGEGPPKQIHR